MCRIADPRPLGKMLYPAANGGGRTMVLKFGDDLMRDVDLMVKLGQNVDGLNQDEVVQGRRVRNDNHVALPRFCERSCSSSSSSVIRSSVTLCLFRRPSVS